MKLIVAVVLAGAALVAGCAGEAKTGGVSTDAGVFTFQPKQGTSYTRTVRWAREVGVAGLPVRRQEVVKVTWKGKIGKDDQNQSTREETLTAIGFAVDGKDLLTAIPSEPVTVRYRFDAQGRAVSIEGGARLADVLSDLLPAAMRTPAAKEAIRDAFEDTQVALFDRVSSDVVGKPAKVGETWSVTPAASSAETLRTYAVKGVEQCAFGTCVRVDSDVQLDPRAVATTVQAAANDLISTSKGEPVVQLREGRYKVDASAVVDPRTMMGVNSKMAAEGAFSFQGPKKGDVTVNVKNTREVQYQYDAQ